MMGKTKCSPSVPRVTHFSVQYPLSNLKRSGNPGRHENLETHIIFDCTTIVLLEHHPCNTEVQELLLRPISGVKIELGQ